MAVTVASGYSCPGRWYTASCAHTAPRQVASGLHLKTRPFNLFSFLTLSQGVQTQAELTATPNTQLFL